MNEKKRTTTKLYEEDLIFFKNLAEQNGISSIPILFQTIHKKFQNGEWKIDSDGEENFSSDDSKSDPIREKKSNEVAAIFENDSEKNFAVTAENFNEATSIFPKSEQGKIATALEKLNQTFKRHMAFFKFTYAEQQRNTERILDEIATIQDWIAGRNGYAFDGAEVLRQENEIALSYQEYHDTKVEQYKLNKRFPFTLKVAMRFLEYISCDEKRIMYYLSPGYNLCDRPLRSFLWHERFYDEKNEIDNYDKEDGDVYMTALMNYPHKYRLENIFDENDTTYVNEKGEIVNVNHTAEDLEIRK